MGKANLLIRCKECDCIIEYLWIQLRTKGLYELIAYDTCGGCKHTLEKACRSQTRFQLEQLKKKGKR